MKTLFKSTDINPNTWEYTPSAAVICRGQQSTMDPGAKSRSVQGTVRCRPTIKNPGFFNPGLVGRVGCPVFEPAAPAARPPSPGFADTMGEAHPQNILAACGQDEGRLRSRGFGAKPLMKMVGPTGFEPATSASQTQRSSQAELRSVVSGGVLQTTRGRPAPLVAIFRKPWHWPTALLEGPCPGGVRRSSGALIVRQTPCNPDDYVV
jgi:hypothetical protein